MVSKRPFAPVAVSLAVAALLTAGLADAALKKAGPSEVTFKAVGTGGLKVDGKSTEVLVSEQNGVVSFTVPLKSIDTGMALRNRHMLEDLEAAAPGNENVVFTVERSALKFPEAGPTQGAAPGKMTLHKQTKPMSISYSASKSGAATTVSGSFPLNLTDYGVKVRSYLGVTVKPDITVSFSAVVSD